MIIAPARVHFAAPIARRSVPTLRTVRVGSAYPAVSALPIISLPGFFALQPDARQPQSSALPHDHRL
jgi:hypothetical protein